MTTKHSCPDIEPPDREEARNLLDKLRPIQESRGYFFNPDTEIALDLLQQLLATKQRFGYMSCPCRLASGSYDNDKDIICPCVYRAPDVEEFGSCFCMLYGNKAWHDGETPQQLVPERRPPEKIV